MPDNELFIYLIMRTEQATRASQVYHQGERQRIAETDQVDERATKERARRRQQELADAVKLQKQIQKEYKEAAAASVKAQEDSQKSQTKALSDAAKARASIVRDFAQADLKAQRDVDNMFKRAQQERIRELEKTQKEHARISTTTRAAELRGLKEEHQLRMQNWAMDQKAIEANKTATDSAMGAIKGWVGAFATIGTVVSAVKSVADYMDHIRRDTIESAKELVHMREAVLELAALKDNLGNTTPETAGQLEFRSKTLQTRQAAMQMNLAAQGVGESAIGVNISKEAFNEGLVGAGQLQALEGSDPNAYGKLMGSLALEAKKGTTGDQLKGQLKKVYDIQRPGAFQSMGQFSDQYAKTSQYVQSGIYSSEENAALLSAMSAYGPDEAATKVDQITRATSSGLMRNRKMKAAPGIETDTSAEYFKKLGITEGMNSMERLNRIADDINKKQDEAAKDRKPFLTTEYLMKSGIRNQEDAKALMDFAATKKSGIWQGTYEPLIKAKADPAGVQKTFDERKGREPVLLNRQAELSKEAATVRRGVGNPEADLAQLQEAAFNRLKADKKVVGDFKDWKERGMLGKASDDALFGGYHNQVNLEAQAMLAREANRVGVNFRAPTRVDAKTGARTQEYVGDKELHRLQQQVQQAGGNPLAGVADDLKAAARDLKESAAKIAAANKPQVPVPLAGVPPVMVR
jgi:hypothetical protein